KKWLTEFELVELRRIASLRIYVERATGRIKILILNLRISNNLTGLSSEIFYVSTFITSFQPPLVKETP
uniref:DDE Tnp4 domain-containing protein n=1 Tax=Amphimedon queenslandica TaxID=400682 RepID=A0A1X7UIS7_AMPQE